MRDDEPSAAEAFEQLRSEVALLRRAVEGLSAATVETAAPDYSPTLAGLRKAIDSVGERLEAQAADPPVTSNQMAAGIAAVAAHARNDSQRELAQAKSVLEKGVRDLAQATGNVRAVRAGRRKLITVGIGSTAAGVGLWIALSGPIARALPETWQAPERMAAATLDRSRWDAGARLMAAADATAWHDLNVARRIMDANADAVRNCREKAAKRGREVSCQVTITAPSRAPR
jgi:hypothetical protein